MRRDACIGERDMDGRGKRAWRPNFSRAWRPTVFRGGKLRNWEARPDFLQGLEVPELGGEYRVRYLYNLCGERGDWGRGL